MAKNIKYLHEIKFRPPQSPPNAHCAGLYRCVMTRINLAKINCFYHFNVGPRHLESVACALTTNAREKGQREREGKGKRYRKGEELNTAFCYTTQLHK